MEKEVATKATVITVMMGLYVNTNIKCAQKESMVQEVVTTAIIFTAVMMGIFAK